MRCPSCQSDDPTPGKFCRACGQPLVFTCAQCGASREPTDRFCHECGAPHDAPRVTPNLAPATLEPERIENRGDEERRPVTILFADIVGFTALSERLDAEIVRDLTTECFRRFVVEALRYEGTVDKFIGDAVMIIFGAPVAHEDDPVRALRVALAMQSALAQFNDELERTHGLRLRLRIGVESGEVVAGLRDVGGVREYTVIGDAVNTAARLQAASEPDTVLVGSATMNRAREAFAFRPIEPLNLKGKAEPVAAYVLLSTPDSGTDASARWIRSPLVGRASELQAFATCLEELHRGRGQNALLSGEPGLGKSRLLSEARSLSADVRWVRCQAFAHEGGLSYGLARNLLRALCGLSIEESDVLTGARLERELGRAGCAQSFPPLAHLLGLELNQEARDQLSALEPQDLQRHTFDAIGIVVTQLANQQPIVIEADDLHWADPTSIDFLQHLAALTERAPVFFCLAMRPERDAPAWALREWIAREYPHRHTEIVLQPLSESSASQLVSQLLNTPDLPAGLQQLIDRAAGTPLWVEELVHSLIERGVLEQRGDRWQLSTEPDHIEVPESLQALLVARIDRLGDARPTLQVAAVIGRRFGERVLGQVADATTTLNDHLLRAQRADLVREISVIPEREYGFKHVLTQEAAYATLLLRRRRELHNRVAECLEHLYPESLDELHPLLAHHYQIAEVWDRAFAHARAAAESSRASYANREAIEQYSRALESAQHLDLAPSELLGLYEARGLAAEILGRFDPAREDFESALDIARASSDRLAIARVLGTLGMLWGGHRNYQRGLDLITESALEAEAVGDRRVLAEARMRLGIMRLNRAEMGAASMELKLALAAFLELNDDVGRAQALDALGMTAFLAGGLTEAIGYASEAVERLEALGDRATQVSCLSVLCLAHGSMGARAESERAFHRGLTISQEINAPASEAFVRLVRSESQVQFGNFEAAFQEAVRGLTIARELDHGEWITMGLSAEGCVRRLCGDPAAALILHEEMLERSREQGATL